MLTYAQAKARLATARWPEEGKPMSGALRLFHHPSRRDVIVLKRYGNEEIANILPDNSVEMLASPRHRLIYWRHFHIDTFRRSKGRYAVHHVPDRAAYAWWKWRRDGTPAPLWASGMRVNLDTGKITGPAMRLPKHNPKKARAWTKKVRGYGRLWRIAARVGGIEGLVREAIEELRIQYDKANAHLTHRQRTALEKATARDIAQIIENQDLSVTAVRQLIRHSLPYWVMSGSPDWAVGYVLGYSRYYVGATHQPTTEDWKKLFSRCYGHWRDEVHLLKGVYK